MSTIQRRKQGQKDPNCRQHNLMMPIELEYRYARAMGIPPGSKPTKTERQEINKQMIRDLEDSVRDIELTARDYEEIAQEIRINTEALTR